MTTEKITEITRRNLFDELELRKFDWAGKLREAEFLSRLYDLSKMRSHDYRQQTMADDVRSHRDHFNDWGGPGWVYTDDRLNLLRCNDEILLRFLCETLHPIVRGELDAEAYAVLFNVYLQRDGFEIYPAHQVSERTIYEARAVAEIQLSGLADAQKLALVLNSTHIAAQITRMRASENDPAMAIGAAKEFVETICKSILSERGAAISGNENLPQLVRATLISLEFKLEAEEKNAIDNAVRPLASLAHGLAEVRGQFGSGHGQHSDTPTPPAIFARLAIGAATTLGLFLFEKHRGISTTHMPLTISGGRY